MVGSPTHAPAPAAFPPFLAAAPAGTRVPQRFGFVPFALAISALFVGAANGAALAIMGVVDVSQLGLVAGAAVVGFAALGFEVWRRTRPTVLVFLPPRIGIYREGKFASDISRGQLTPYRLRITNTLRELMSSGIITLMGLVGTIAILAGSGLDATQLPALAWSFGAFAGAGAWFVSAIWVRVMCVYYWIPRGNRVEQVVLRRSDLARVGFPIVG